MVMQLTPNRHYFAQSGLYPINRKVVTDRLPSKDKAKAIACHIDKALLDKLEERRFPVNKRKGRGKKIPAGKSYTDDQEEEEEEDLSEDDGGSGGDESVGPPSSSEDEAEEEPEIEQPEEVDSDLESLPEIHHKTGQFVVAVYEEEWFLAEVALEQEDVAKGYTRLKYMAIKGANSFAWGLRPDIHVACNDDILLPIVSEPVNSRGHLGVNKKDLAKVHSLMVEFYLFPLTLSSVNFVEIFF